MSRLCSGSQYSVEANWMGQLEVTVQYVVLFKFGGVSVQQVVFVVCGTV